MVPATETVPAQQKTTRPNEQGSVTVSAFFKIWDPNNKKTYVEGRA